MFPPAQILFPTVLLFASACERSSAALRPGPDIGELVAVEILSSEFCWDPDGPFPQHIGRIAIRHRGGAPALEASALDAGPFAVVLPRGEIEPGGVVEADVMVASPGAGAGALSLFFAYASTELLGTHVASVPVRNAAATPLAGRLRELCGELPPGFYRGLRAWDPEQMVRHACPKVPAKVPVLGCTRILRYGGFRTDVDPSRWHGDAAAGSETLAGEYCVVFFEVEGAVEEAAESWHVQYGFAFGSDGDAGNDYTPAPDFAHDFFGGTDRWYELRRRPGSEWELRVTDARGGDYRVVESGARLVLDGARLVLAVPVAELSAAEPSFRVTAFAHRGDFGLQRRHRWSGGTAPALGEPLAAIR